MSRTVSRRSASANRPVHGDGPDTSGTVQALTSFVGREDDLATVTSLLRRPDVRLVTVTGTGGVGKTRLALRAAGTVADSFPDGGGGVALAPVRDPAMLLPTIAQRLNVPDAPDGSSIDRLRSYLTDRDLLLVLDNLEHLLDAVPDIASLLATCPHLTILCTCRAELNVSGEHLVPLAPLPAAAGRALFVDRVRARVPHFTLTDDLAPVIDAICQRLDGLPLAIELAASRVPALPPPALLARLERRLDLLTNGPRDAPRRLRDMRDAIAWSHDLLPEPQQRLFRRLGVFIGGFTLEAAESVAGGDNVVLDGIAALVAASLVIPTEGVAGDPRYTMLETIREYALERLAASEEESETRARHADHYRSLAEDALPLFDGPEIRVACDRVEIELDNCRGAMAWSLENEAAQTGIRLAGALWRIWSLGQMSGGKPWMDRVAEGLAWVERMLPMRNGLPVEALTEALIGGGGAAYVLRKDIDRLQTSGEELLARAHAEGYPYGEFWASLMLGYVTLARNDTITARKHFELALSLAPTIRNPTNHEAIARQNLGELEMRASDPAAAAQHLEEALRLSREIDNPWIIGDTSAGLGRALLEQGQCGRAAALMRDGLLTFSNLRRMFDIHSVLTDLARVALAIDQPVRAARLLGVAETISIYPEFSLRPGLAATTARATRETQSSIGEAAFAAEAKTGRGMVWDEVLAEIDALVTAASDTTTARPPTPASQHGLSRRETEVLRFLVEGHSNRAIAEELTVSERTVENHVFHIFNKLNVNSRAAAAAYAIRNGLL